MSKQCQLLGVNRSSLYNAPCREDSKNLLYMRLLDEQYTEDPSYGVLRMTHHLRSLGHEVNPKRVRRLLRLMGPWKQSIKGQIPAKLSQSIRSSRTYCAE